MLSFGIFCLEASLGTFQLEYVAKGLFALVFPFVSVSLGRLAWELSLGAFRLGTLAGSLSLGIFR